MVMDRKQLGPIPFMLNVPHSVASSQKKRSKCIDSHGVEVSNATNFPMTRAILWNRSIIEKSIGICFSYERKIKMCISERALLLASKHGTATNGFLVGSFVSELDGILLQVDRFDPGRNVQIETGNGFITRRVPTAIIPGDHVISFKLNQSICRNDIRSTLDSDTLLLAIEVLKNRICKKHPINISDLFVSHASFRCQTDVNELIVDLECYMLSFAAEFVASPINEIPIIPTALAKNLSGPLRLTQVQGIPKFGYLTMDQTRKLLLLLETDPKADSLPLVGIWISGIDVISHPYVWACCLRFVSADYIQERVMAPPASILLVHYSTTKAYPNFYECQLKKEQSHDSKVLLKCKEQLIISKSGNSKDDICLELERDEDFNFDRSNEAEVVRREFDPNNSTGKSNELGHRYFGANEGQLAQQYEKDNEDIPTPRPNPEPFSTSAEPHPRTPSVPELSLIDEQPILKSATKNYNPMIYQEANSIGQSRIETTVEETAGQSYLPHDHHQSHSQYENQKSFSLADLEPRINMKVLAYTRQLPPTSDSEKNPERTVIEGKESLSRQDEIAIEVRERKLPGIDLMPSDPDVENPGNSSVEHGSINTEENRGLHALSKIAEHEKQLMELQEQIRELIKVKTKEETKLIGSFQGNAGSFEDTAVQCSMIVDTPEKETTGVNTGDSLILIGNASQEIEMDTCRCCDYCQRRKSKENRRRSSSSRSRRETETLGRQPVSSNERTVNVSNTDNTYSLSDIKEGDIEMVTAADNPASTSIQSFASDFQGVDLPVFDDSHNNEPRSPNDIALGTSASMVDVNSGPRPESGHSLTIQADMNDGRGISPGGKSDANFYMEMMEEVKVLLNEHAEVEEQKQSENSEDAISCTGETVKESEDFPKEGDVTKVVVEPLHMVDHENSDSGSATEVCDVINKQSRDVVSYHPRINYVSLLGTETSDDANALADEIALKYLTSNQMHNIQYNVTQKTKSVKFEGVLHDESVLRTPKISMNFLSMNVSCNMSIATKRYMQKYNLLENETRPRRNIPPLLKKDTKIDDAVTANESSDKENERSNILDLNKLKKLPKLM